MNDAHDLSPHWRGNTVHEARVARRLVELQQTPHAIRHLERTAHLLRDYHYWYFLSSCWVGYSGHFDLPAWKRLFRAKRPLRAESLMKPSEVRALAALPDTLTVFRAHRPDESDWIAYTLDPAIAWRFARERSVDRVAVYRVQKADVLALFTRRGEQEVLVLDRARAEPITILPRTWTASADARGIVSLRCPQDHLYTYTDRCPACGDQAPFPVLAPRERRTWAAPELPLTVTLAETPTPWSRP